jgi:hypothetical protein
VREGGRRAVRCVATKEERSRKAGAAVLKCRLQGKMHKIKTDSLGRGQTQQHVAGGKNAPSSGRGAAEADSNSAWYACMADASM